MRVLVTAGPTHEYIDDVRFISNPSSGMMGYAIARAAASRGHIVTLISGPVALQPPPRVSFVPVTSAMEMHRAVLRRFPRSDVLFMTAAVGDFRPRVRTHGKIKKDKKGVLTLQLVRNPDILAECGRLKKDRQILVGFALEPVNLQAITGRTGCDSSKRQGRREDAFWIGRLVCGRGGHYPAEDALFRPGRRCADFQRAFACAWDKLARKNLDYIFLNSPAAFGAKGIQGLLLSASGDARFFRNVPKSRLAMQLVMLVEKLWAATAKVECR